MLHVGQEQARDLFLLQSLVDFQRLLDSDKSGAYKLADENTLSKGNMNKVLRRRTVYSCGHCSTATI